MEQHETALQRSERTKPVQKSFGQAYRLTLPYSAFICVVSIRTLGVIQETREGYFGEGRSIEGLPITSDHDLSETCLYVGLNAALPADLALPEVFEGVRVYREVIGELRAQEGLRVT